MEIVNVLMDVFFIILTIVGIYVTLYSLYFIFISFFGFGKAKKDYELIEDETRFLILVAAHNEEAVIGSTIENLKKIDYNKDLYDIYVVNDNSTDRTGEICDEYGIKHVDTAEKLFPREGVGKPAGLQYALRALGFEKLTEKYDVLMVLDADNHVDSNILKELNSQFIQKGRPEAIQSYLDSKNTTNSLSLGYALGYFYTNRFFQLAKYRLGLPNAIGGTGFIVRLDFLMKHGGFKFNSLTEDLELEMAIVLENGRILWNHFTRIYDEKPEKLKASIKQRTRWSQGHWYVAFTHFFPFMKKLLTDKGKIRYLDQLIYLFSMSRAVHLLLGLIGLVISGAFLIINKDTAILSTLGKNLLSFTLGTSIVALVFFFYQLFICLRYAIIMDSKYKYNFLKMTFSLLYYGYTFIYAQIVGLIKWRQQNTWVKTEHVKTTLEHHGKAGE